MNEQTEHISFQRVALDAHVDDAGGYHPECVGTARTSLSHFSLSSWPLPLENYWSALVHDYSHLRKIDDAHSQLTLHGRTEFPKFSQASERSVCLHRSRRLPVGDRLLLAAARTVRVSVHWQTRSGCGPCFPRACRDRYLDLF